MRVAIATVQVPFVRGGAELHAEGLVAAIRAAGHEAEIVALPFQWHPPGLILQQMLAWRLLDLTESMGTRIDRVIGLKFPAYLAQHPDKVQWVLHQHRPAYDLWDQQTGGMFGHPDGQTVRDAIHAADTRLLPQARRVYANSRNVADRLMRYCGITAEPLYHPPPLAARYHGGEPGDYLLMPSRVNTLKRQALIVEALRETRQPVHVVFIGAADDQTHTDTLMARAELYAPGRTTWLASVNDARKIDLFATALAVLVPPNDEDYGYVTLEAMLSARPVITCTDSGGPLEFVEHGRTGLICDPNPAALAHAMDTLWSDRILARTLGVEGLAHYRAIGPSWEHVVQCLLG